MNTQMIPSKARDYMEATGSFHESAAPSRLLNAAYELKMVKATFVPNENRIVDGALYPFEIAAIDAMTTQLERLARALWDRQKAKSA